MPTKRTCHRCGSDGPFRPTYRICRGCERARQRVYDKESGRQERRDATRIARKRVVIDKAKASGCCVCGEREMVCLDFHHRDPAEKEFSIGTFAGSPSGAVERLEAEIAKCAVICANCHRKLHAGLVAVPS